MPPVHPARKVGDDACRSAFRESVQRTDSCRNLSRKITNGDSNPGMMRRDVSDNEGPGIHLPGSLYEAFSLTMGVTLETGNFSQ